MKAKELHSQLNKGLDLFSQRDAFSLWAEKYLKGKESTVGARTLMCVRSSLKHLSPIYNLKLAKIKPQHIEDILQELAAGEKPLSKKTLTDIRNNAFGVFRLAIKNRVIDFNPASVVDVPRGATREKREALTEEQIRWIIETEHNAQTAAMIMLYAGLRRGELVALTWTDIDLKQGTIRVNKSGNSSTISLT